MRCGAALLANDSLPVGAFKPDSSAPSRFEDLSDPAMRQIQRALMIAGTTPETVRAHLTRTLEVVLRCRVACK